MKSVFRSLAAAFMLTQLGLAACVNTERELATSSDQRSQFTPPTGRGQRVNGATVLNTVRATHAFSNPPQADVFLLQMRGPRILTSQLHFSIMNSQGDTLHHEVLPARLLLDDPTLRDNVSASVRDKEISVLRGMNAFFSASHFVQPAAGATTPQPAGVDTPTWNSLRHDPTAIGFDFTGPGGTPRRLVYSRQLKQAILLNE